MLIGDQNQDWSKPIIVLLHPVNADGQGTTQQYIQQLTPANLKGVQGYLEQMSATYRGQPIAIYFQLGRELKQLPPKVPEQASLLDTVLWSLKFPLLCMEKPSRFRWCTNCYFVFEVIMTQH